MGKTAKSPPPIFVMVDPYGVRGVPLDLLKRLLKIDRSEIFRTTLAAEWSTPVRFLMSPHRIEPMVLLHEGIDSGREP